MIRLAALLAIVCAALGGPQAAAQDYPTRQVRILSPYAPGGAVDITSRILAEQLRTLLGQPFVVESKPGAFGIVAIEEMLRGKPDGYSVMVGNVTTNGITPVVYPGKFKAPFDKTVVPVTKIADVPAFLITTTAGGFQPASLKDMIEWAKANPGKLRYGSPSLGSFPHFDSEILIKRAGFTSVHIPNKAGAAGVTQDLVSGDVHWSFVNVATVGGLVKAGTLRPLAVVNQTRLAQYPDVPTMDELGYPGVGTTQWLAMYAPAETPRDILVKLNKAVNDAIALPVVQEQFAKGLFIPSPSKSLEEAAKWQASEIERWTRIVAESGIKLE